MATAQQAWVEELQQLVTNPLDREAVRGRRIAAILGDVPSTYAKSPTLWNAAFRALKLEALYIPLDVPADRLKDVLQLLRMNDQFLGGSVTVPYKQQVIPLLDAVDPLTARIGAVNVIVRTPEGRLLGYNTDGLGGVQALVQAGGMADLRTARILMIGAGGAAQAVAFALWEQMTQGELIIANRSRATAQTLVQRLSESRPGLLAAITEDEIAGRLRAMDVLINCTVKGQAGIRKLPDGRITCLEPYSSLASAHPTGLPAAVASEDPSWYETWFRQSLADIQRNHQQSLALCARLPRTTVCYDIIYAPLETVLLRHARWGGHRTLNGREMNLRQAVEAFARYVCKEWLAQRGLSNTEGLARLRQAMAEEWGK